MMPPSPQPRPSTGARRSSHGTPALIVSMNLWTSAINSTSVNVCRYPYLNISTALNCDRAARLQSATGEWPMPEKYSIAFFGSSLISAYWNGAATYYRGIIRALHGLGHRVTFYEPDAFDRQKHRDMPDPEWARVVVYSSADESQAMRMLDQARDADIIVKAIGVGVHDGLPDREVLRFREDGKLVVFWDVDAPATLERAMGDRTEPFRELIRQYDLILTYGGGDAVV